ncbi:Bgt-1283 [Blumeria graminis f. sp. tritici]|uniref:Alpha-mannosidase n=2 Tax=Blumeria graminis f. sp. tritici TaxID=62690 RepID=A0A061HID7_BLUGR|nr:Vacuolar alpha mannosidase [Blumeria graminis f. sp. tritici 96224]VDB90689.1 Bgt-1283 [Blumeria graminis f. sp. tritici]
MGGENSEASKPETNYPKLAERPVGQWVPDIYKNRIERFYENGQYGEVNLRAMMYEGVVSGYPHVKISVWDAPGLSRPNFKEATSHNFRPTSVGESFGPSWSTHWFKLQLTVPVAFIDKELLELHWDANNEGMVWTEDGKPLQGLTGGGERIEWVLPESFRDGKEHTIYIEMACNGMFGNAPGGDSIQPPNPQKYFPLSKAEIVVVNVEARQLHIDAWIIGDAAREFPTDSWEQHKALRVVNEIIDTFELGNNESILKGRKLAQQYLGKNVDSAQVYETGTMPIVFGIGHCHIDTCWLWPWAETKRKVARSWSNQCDLMDRYPEHRFAVSQAQQYKWLKQEYPYIFERVTQKVLKGTFQPVGGSWVEHDTNMPSGESLIRQFLYGQRFFESHFGERCKTFWLPDTFGYSSQLPQLCRLAGMTRFFTQKLSWNNINKFPHTTFNWVSLDGSQVVCHMTPAETYTANAEFGDVKRSISQHKSMDQDETSLLVFGKGDGGGGPTWEHLEKLRRCRGMSDTIGKLPRVHMGKSVDDFFDQLERKIENGLDLVTWYGELYFELHRGTYTTQAKNKRNNRFGEIMLRSIELLATISSTQAGYKYPKEKIDEMWEAVLLCQFHDCLPGTSIEMCYDDSDALYTKVFETGDKILKEIYGVLGIQSLQSTKNKLVALNTMPWYRKEIVSIGEGQMGIARGDGQLLEVCQFESDMPQVTVKETRPGVFVLKNSQLRVEVERGCIISLYDILAEREVIPKGEKANQFVIFDDKPLYWQAWDVEVYHLNSRKALLSGQTKIIRQNAHQVCVMTETRISDVSQAKTYLTLSPAFKGHQSYIEVYSEIEWHENMKFLKVEFPVEIRNTEASYETQFGIVRRPTHYNTSWDMAKFEVCCHKFADLSEHGYGVSILNDSKYGFATCGNQMRLSLLRAPKAPDAHADMGCHHIRWAILPHEGSLGSTTIRSAFNFNNPLKIFEAQKQLPKVAYTSPIRLTGNASLILDTIKRGEDDEDISCNQFLRRKGKSIILRIYDSLGGRSRGTIETTFEVKKVWKTNVLEDDEEQLSIIDRKIEISLRPFEVATYRLQL